MADAVPATADTKRAQEREYEDRLVARAQSIVEGASLCIYALKGARAERNPVAARQSRDVLAARAQELLKIASELTPDQGL